MKNNRIKAGVGLRVLLPIGMLIGICIFDDYLFPLTRLTSFLSFVGLAILAFILRPRDMVAWSLIFMAFVSFRVLSAIQLPLQPGDITPYVRVCGFAVAVAVTSGLCFYRARLQDHADEVLDILSKLPIPVLISNDSGAIIFTNEKAASLLQMDATGLIGLSYFSLLINPDSQGRTIAHYIQIIDSSASGEVSIPLKVRGREDLKVTGAITRTDFSGTRALITVLEVEPAG